MKKRILSLLFAALLLVSTSGCGNSKKNYANNEENNKQTTEEEENTASTDLNGSDAADKDYDPNSWVNPGSLTSPYAIANAAAKASPSIVAITTESVSYSGFYGNYVCSFLSVGRHNENKIFVCVIQKAVCELQSEVEHKNDDPFECIA